MDEQDVITKNCGSDENGQDWEKGCGKPVNVDAKEARRWRGIYFHDHCLENIPVTVLRTSRYKAAKLYQCANCRKTITIGERYSVTVLIVDGEFYTRKSHDFDGYCNEPEYYG